MANETDIKEELLKQMEKNSNRTSDANIKSPQQIIVRDARRVKRLKWIAIFSWLLVAICFIATVFLEWARDSGVLIDIERAWLSSLVIILRAMFVIAIILTISLYIRSRTLTIRQIHIRLANIEELLKKMSQDK